jgi:hypothetical protein
METAMSILTLLAYLFGSRAAIERVVADPWAVWVGLALVLSAGLARSYRTRDLRAQPWHLVLPVGVSLVLALCLYGVLAAKLVPAGGAPFPRGLGSIVALVLLTAPLAWLYAIPYERYLSWPRAVRARLITLGVVATWRVTLIVRAISVLLDDRLWLALCLVLLVADTLALAGLILPALIRAQTNKPLKDATPMLLGAMSGVEAAPARVREPGRDILMNWTIVVTILGVVTLPIWVMGVDRQSASAAQWRELLADPAVAEGPTVDVWLLAGVAVGFFAGLLPWTQRAPRLRTRVEKMLMAGQESEALRLMSAHEPKDFPPGWVPPPESDFRDPPRLLDLVDDLTSEPHADWVREVYLPRFRNYLADLLWFWFYDDDLEKLVTILKRLPDGPALARQIVEAAPAIEKKARLSARNGPMKSDDPDDDFVWWRLHPEPKPSGRRPEIVLDLERLAGRQDVAGGAAPSRP